MIQSKIPAMRKSADNPFFNSKYTPLPDIVEALKPILDEAGVVVSFVVEDWNGDTVTHDVMTKKGPIRVMLASSRLVLVVSHVSGGEESVRSSMIFFYEIGNPQKFGSAVTFNRRYMLTSFFNIVSEDDDDGNSAAGNTKTSAPKAGDAPDLPGF